MSSSPVRISLVPWGDPLDESCTTYWGLRVNGAYLGRPGKPRLWATRREALAAKRSLAFIMAAKTGDGAPSASTKANSGTDNNNQRPDQ